MQFNLFSEKIYSEETTILESAKKAAFSCTKCPLHEKRRTVVYGEGCIKNPLIFFIGEGPGEQEDLHGRPFVGKAGLLLDKMIEAMGLKRAQCYISNVVLCRPPNNRVPTPEEVNQCINFLNEQIEITQPSVLVTLGGTATKTVIKTSKGIMSVRGEWYSVKNRPLMPTFHPAALLRNPQWKVLAWDDLKKVVTKLKLLERI